MCPVIDIIAACPIVLAAFFFDERPCACVIRRNLVPVSLEVLGDFLVVVDKVSKELFCSIGEPVAIAGCNRILEIFLEPCHRWSFDAVFDEAGTALFQTVTRKPSFAINVSPKRYACNIIRFHQDWEMFLVALFLKLIVYGTDIVLGNVYREACLLVGFMKSTLECRRTEALITGALLCCLVELHPVSIDGSALGLDFLDKINPFFHLPQDCVIVVVNQDCMRPTLTRHFECRHHKFVVAIVAAESLNQFGRGKTGVVVFARFDRLIDHFNHVEVGVMFFNRINPISPSLFCFVNIEFDQPLRVLRTPQKCMEREICVVCFCPVVAEVATRPVVLAAFFFDMAPVAFIFDGNLVPVSSKVVGDFAKGSGVA